MLNDILIKQYGTRNKKLRKIGFNTYEEYLHSEQWKKVKDKWEIRKVQSPQYWSKCNCCGTSEKLILHHIRYGKIGSNCKLGGMIPVCMNCHTGIHSIAHNPNYKGSIKQATREWRKLVYKKNHPIKVDFFLVIYQVRSKA